VKHAESNAMNDAKETHEELAADGRPSGVEAEQYSPYPFDVKKISIARRQISLSNILRRLQRKSIMAADIQRGDNLWDEGKKSRLIESLMLKIPLPLFYAACDNDDVLTVVDGLQRISSIRQYVMEGKFRLEGLEYLNDLNGNFYGSLPDDMKIRIEETELDFVIINPDSPPEIHRNIFKRLNTGGMPLTDQEIRHALFFGPSTNMLKELANAKEFIEATDDRVDDSRMAAQELVLRYWAFSMFGVSEYRKNEDMDSFLSDTMQAMNNLINDAGSDLSRLIKDRTISNGNIGELKDNFILAMKRSHKLFGECAFRITTPTRKSKSDTRTPINKSLFDVWSILLSKMPESQFKKLYSKRKSLFRLLDEELDNSASVLRRSIGQDSTKIGGVKWRHDKIGKIVEEIVGEP